MDRFVFLISYFVLAAIGTSTGSHVLPAAEVYWQKVLPNTPMPNALTDILNTERLGVDMNGHNLKDMYHFPDTCTRNYFADRIGNRNYFADTDTCTRNYFADTVGNRNYEKNMGKKTHDEPNDVMTSIFFLEKDLQPGATKSIEFKTYNIPRSTMNVPRKVENAIPFSSAKLSEILRRFSIKPDSILATATKKTLEECEMPEHDGEHKLCATSLELLVESSMLMLGTRNVRNVRALSTTVSKKGTIPKQTYKVASSGLQRLPGSDAVACHPVIYPSTVFYCHTIRGTKAYKVALTGKDGTKVEAVAVCHTETTKWNPNHIAFQVLKVKPGTLPICHILMQYSLIWIPNK